MLENTDFEKMKKISKGIDKSFVSKFHVNQLTGMTFSCGVPKRHAFLEKNTFLLLNY